MTIESTIALLTALGAGAIGQHLVSLIADRWRGHLEERQARATALEDTRAALRRWEEAAWATRHAAVRAGVDPETLPDLPTTDKEH